MPQLQAVNSDFLAPWRPAPRPSPRPPRLLCAARYGALGASSRVRLTQYLPALRQAGLAVTQRAFLPDSYLRALYNGKRLPRAALAAWAYLRALTAPLDARRHDLLWIEKEFLPYIPFALEQVLRGGTPYVLDLDDAWSLRYESSPNAIVRALLAPKFGQLVRGAALTLTANETLHRWAQAQGARATLLLPTVVDIQRYTPRPPPDGVFTLGWIGTPLTAPYLRLMAEPLRQLATEAPLKLRIIGADVSLPGVDCDSLPWHEDTEADLLSGCHAGIMPVPDDPWGQGKSGYKLIQYMAAARPAVASAVGANLSILHHGETGFLARTPEDWLTALRHLRDNPAQAQHMGSAGRDRAARHYSLDVTAPLLTARLLGILEQIAPQKAQISAPVLYR